MTKYRVTIEVYTDGLPAAQLLAASLKTLASQVILSDLFQHELEARNMESCALGPVALEQMPPAQWQSREFRQISQLIHPESLRNAWHRMLELPDFPVDD